MLNKSFYVSVFTRYLPLKELFDLPVTEAEQALKAFARFIYRVHTEGVFHKDLTIRNVLYIHIGNKYDFSLIDNNRMRFHRYTFKRGMHNLNRLMLPVETIGIIAAEYAHLAAVSEVRTLNAMLFARWRSHISGMLKRWVKLPLYLFLPRYRNSSAIIRKEATIVAREAFNK
jgi:hypothetical protein